MTPSMAYVIILSKVQLHTVRDGSDMQVRRRMRVGRGDEMAANSRFGACPAVGGSGAGSQGRESP